MEWIEKLEFGNGHGHGHAPLLPFRYWYDFAGHRIAISGRIGTNFAFRKIVNNIFCLCGFYGGFWVGLLGWDLG